MNLAIARTPVFESDLCDAKEGGFAISRFFLKNRDRVSRRDVSAGSSFGGDDYVLLEPSEVFFSLVKEEFERLSVFLEFLAVHIGHPELDVDDAVGVEIRARDFDP